MISCPYQFVTTDILIECYFRGQRASGHICTFDFRDSYLYILIIRRFAKDSNKGKMKLPEGSVSLQQNDPFENSDRRAMGGSKKDLVRKRYFRNNSRQADLLNACMKKYQLPGEAKKAGKVFTKEDFAVCDSELYTLVKDKGRKKQRDRIVDSIRLVGCDGGRFYLILENQERVDYSMPVRILDHESIFYHEQIKTIGMEHKKKEELHTPEEWFSGMKKEDRLIPALSLVLYYGTEPWDGAKDMEELLQTEEIPEELLVLIRNYPMNLIQIRDIDYLEKFQTDLHETFGFIKYQHDSGRLTQFVEKNRERFRNLRKMRMTLSHARPERENWNSLN